MGAKRMQQRQKNACRDASRRYGCIHQLCSEDVEHLGTRIARWIEAGFGG